MHQLIGTLGNAREALLRSGAVSGTTTCHSCGHSFHLHYGTPEGHQGCVSDKPYPTLNALIKDQIKTAPTSEDGSCLCPGWIQGQLPYEITKHLEGLTWSDEGEEHPCDACTHTLDEHSDPYGCWSCPCDVTAL